MSDLGGLDDDQNSGAAAEVGGSDGTSKKSERKRQREKQRRSDLASAFDELAALLSRIDPDDMDASSNSKKQRRRRSSSGEAAAEPELDTSGMTRLDLIGRAIETLRKIYRENTELRQRLDAQRHGGVNDEDRVRGSFSKVSLFLRVFFLGLRVLGSNRSLFLTECR